MEPPERVMTARGVAEERQGFGTVAMVSSGIRYMSVP
jgi:hypothetical protein